jgi:hypothetical protein
VPPADAGATVVLPTNVAKVVPAQVGPTTQSEPTPTYTVPPFDPRPYVALCEQNPKVRQLVDNIAAQEHIDPARLAWHWNQESKFSTDLTMRGKAGEVGPLQMLPGTMDQIDPGHTVDRNTLQGQLTLAARYIHTLDTRYGQDAPLSFAAYQGGTGSADAIQAGEGRYHPNTVAYMAAAFPGQRIDSSTMPPPLEVDPVAAIKAGTAGGPDGFIHYIAQSGATGQQMSAKWRAAETALVSLAAYRGDIDGMRHAQDYVLQMSQQGTNMALQQAYQAITVGNGTVAAQALARAHAFFPDGTMGRFGVDKDGNVWGIRVDENNPNQTIGNHFQVRPQDVQQLLVQTLDPNQFRQMVTEQQQANAVIRSTNAHGDYYLNLIQERATAAQDAVNERYFQADQNNKTRALIAQEADATRQQTAQLAEQGQRDKGVAAQALKLGSSSAFERGDATPKDIDKEVANTFRQDGTDPTTANWGPGQYDMAASVYSDLRLNSPSGSMNPVSATSVSKGVINGDYLIRPTIGGKYAVIPRATPNGPPRAILSGSVGARLYSAMMGAPKPAALPAVGRLMPAGGGSAVPMQPQQQQAIAR